METADSPVRHTVRLTTADREVTIPVFLFPFPGVNVGSADGGSGVNIQSKAPSSMKKDIYRQVALIYLFFSQYPCPPPSGTSKLWMEGSKPC